MSRNSHWYEGAGDNARLLADTIEEAFDGLEKREESALRDRIATKLFAVMIRDSVEPEALTLAARQAYQAADALLLAREANK